MWKARILFSLLIATTVGFSTQAQQLIINEVSQGTGAKEYVEFVVIGNPTCQSAVPSIDLRGVIIDDNNGFFAPGAGTGIASGALRFANVSFWSAVPQGTYIVVYNESDVNPALPPDDISLTDGNCRLIIPANSNLLEGTSVSPTSSISTYPVSGWTVGGGSWSQVAMSNTNDSFQIPNLGINGTPLHGVSWGNNTNGAIIYFAGSSAGKVFSFTNGTSNDWNLQANWTAGNVGTNETPGAANNANNDAWIASMNPQCGIGIGMQVTVQTTPMSCGTACNGTATAQVTGGTAPYTYLWSNGATTGSISNLCTGTYTVEVTDAGGCTFIAQGIVQSGNNTLQVTINSTNESCAGLCDGSAIAIASGGTQPYQYAWNNGVVTDLNPNLCPGNYTVGIIDQNGCTATTSTTILAGTLVGDATIAAAGPYTSSDPTVQLQSATAGGTWLTADCATCLSTNGVFNPQTAGVGTFQICYTVGSGICQANDCIDITVTQGCTPQTTQETVTFCAEDSVFVFGNWEHTAGNYAQTFIDLSGCDSTHTITLSVNSANPINDAIGLCTGDSVMIFGNWIYQTGTYSQQEENLSGCEYTHTFIVYPEVCEVEEFFLYVPNVFTPDGDNINDTFKIELIGGEVNEGWIFNRWGNQIKQFDPLTTTWDGKTTSGEDVQDGVYTYLIYYTPTNGIRLMIHGSVTVIR